MKFQHIKINQPANTQVKFRGKELDVLLDQSTIEVPTIGLHNGSSSYFNIDQTHNCGAQGYNPMLGDKCSGCEEENYKSNALSEVMSQLEKRKIISVSYKPLFKQ